MSAGRHRALGSPCDVVTVSRMTRERQSTRGGHEPASARAPGAADGRRWGPRSRGAARARAVRRRLDESTRIARAAGRRTDTRGGPSRGPSRGPSHSPRPRADRRRPSRLPGALRDGVVHRSWRGTPEARENHGAPVGRHHPQGRRSGTGIRIARAESGRHFRRRPGLDYDCALWRASSAPSGRHSLSTSGLGPAPAGFRLSLPPLDVLTAAPGGDDGRQDRTAGARASALS
jgi:hypothetical protein